VEISFTEDGTVWAYSAVTSNTSNASNPSTNTLLLERLYLPSISKKKKRKSTSVIAVKIHLVGWLGSEVSTGLVLVFVSASARSGLDAFEAVFEVTHIQC